jgi:hypothetical protein
VTARLFLCRLRTREFKPLFVRDQYVPVPNVASHDAPSLWREAASHESDQRGGSISKPQRPFLDRGTLRRSASFALLRPALPFEYKLGHYVLRLGAGI